MDLRHHLDTQVTEINRELGEMASRVCNALERSFKLLHQYDPVVAEQVYQDDKRIDALEMEIDDRCLQLIATEQPVASDLRRIIAITKITTNLERIGDIARYVTRNAKKEVPENFVTHIPPIIAMGTYGTQMLRDAMEAYNALNQNAAREIAARDDAVDEKHHELRREVIRSMRNDPEHIKNGQRLLVQSRLMELLGDHVTTICEWIIFIIDGTHTDLN